MRPADQLLRTYAPRIGRQVDVGAPSADAQHASQVFRHFGRAVPLQNVLYEVQILVRDRLEVRPLAVLDRGTHIAATRGHRALDDRSDGAPVEIAPELSKAKVYEPLVDLAATVGICRPEGAQDGDGRRKGSDARQMREPLLGDAQRSPSSIQSTNVSTCSANRSVMSSPL